MTIGEFFIGILIMVITLALAFSALIGFLLLISGLPLLAINLYRNFRNKNKISFREILIKIYL